MDGKVYVEASVVADAVEKLGNTETGALLAAVLERGKVTVLASDLETYMQESVKRSKGRPSRAWSEARARLLEALEGFEDK